MAKPTTNKSKSSKKSSRKKLHNAVHPYMECIQAEVTSLQEQLTSFETKQDLTTEEKSEKAITEACLERYQATLAKFAEPSMLSKLQQFNSIAENEIKQRDETQTISFLQLLYLMRLGQLGLYQYINQAPPLASVASLSDQIIGAAVHYAKDKSHHHKQKVHDLLKKYDQGSTEKIDQNDQTTFKQIKDFLQHIWDNTTDAEHVNNKNNQVYSVLQFEGIIPQQNLTMDTQAPPSDQQQQQQTNLEPTETNVEQPTESNVEQPKETIVEPTKDTPEPTTTSETTTPTTVDSPKETTAPPLSSPVPLDVSDKTNQDSTTPEEKKQSGWDEEIKTDTQTNRFDSWEPKEQQKSEEDGWNSIETKTTIDDWNNRATSWDKENAIEDNTTTAVESNNTKDSTENDNWRSRDEGGRGRGRGARGGLRGRGRGSGPRGGRGRGRGGPVRGRGRGRGRETDDDYNREFTPSQQTTQQQ